MTPELVSKLFDGGIAGAILAFIMWFVVAQVWPWWTKDYLPRKLALEHRELDILQGLKEALIGLKTLGDHQVSLLQDVSRKVDQIDLRQRIFLDRYNIPVVVPKSNSTTPPSDTGSI